MTAHLEVAVEAMLTVEPIDEPFWSQHVRDSGTGAVAVFAGVVRDHDQGRAVSMLEYSAHPSAADRLSAAAHDIAAAHPEVTAIALAHRIGTLAIGDTALFVAVGSAHRRTAFVACAELVDLVKQTVPIWKLQTYRDGTTDWVGCP